MIKTLLGLLSTCSLVLSNIYAQDNFTSDEDLITQYSDDECHQLYKELKYKDTVEGDYDHQEEIRDLSNLDIYTELCDHHLSAWNESPWDE